MLAVFGDTSIYWMVGEVKNRIHFDGYTISYRGASTRFKHLITQPDKLIPLSDLLIELEKHITKVKDDHRKDDIILYGYVGFASKCYLGTITEIKNKNAYRIRWLDDSNSIENSESMENIVNLSSILRQM